MKLSCIVDLSCRDTSLQKDSVMKNMYAEANKNKKISAIKRPAFHTAVSPITSTSSKFRGLYNRKNTIALRPPPNLYDSHTFDSLEYSGAQEVRVFEANRHGQFISGYQGVVYAENNNSANWSHATNLDRGGDIGLLQAAIFNDPDDTWVVLSHEGNVRSAARSDLTTWTDHGAIEAAWTGGGAVSGISYASSITNQYVVVGATTPYIKSSADLVTWTSRTNPSSQALNAITSNRRDLYIAVGGNGTIIKSSDGITWTAVTSPTSATLYDIKWYPNNTWIIVGNGVVLRSTSSNPTSFTDVSPSGLTTGLGIYSRIGVQRTYTVGTVSLPNFIITRTGSYAPIYSQDGGATWSAGTYPNEVSTYSITPGAIGPTAIIESTGYGTDSMPDMPYAAGWGIWYTSTLPPKPIPITSYDGITWFVGKFYNQHYYVHGDAIGQLPINDLSSVFYTNLGANPFGSTASRVARYAKAYFAEMSIGSNSVMGILVPGDGTVSATEYPKVGNFAFCMNNSRPITFDGRGASIDDGRMLYPFEANRAGHEYLVHGLVSIDGYMFYMTNVGNIYHCEANDITHWPALNVINAQYEGDEGVALVKHHNSIVAFGHYTTEFFYNANNTTGSVLSRREDVRFKVGVAAPNSVETYGDASFFVGQTREGAKAVYMLDNYQLSQVSTPEIEALLNTLSTWTKRSDAEQNLLKNIIGSVLEYNGHIFYILTLFGASKLTTLVYDAITKLWHHWESDLTAVANSWWNGESGITLQGVDILSTVVDQNNQRYIATTNGTIYECDKSQYVDGADTAINIEIRLPPVEDDNISYTNRKRHRRATYIGERTDSSSIVNLSYTDDDYQTWSSDKALDISTNFPRINNLGSARRRAYRLTHADSTDLVTYGLELEIGNRRS